MPRERNGGEAILRGVKICAILYLNARLELCEIEKVPSVDRQVFNLFSSEQTLHRRLFGIHGNRGTLHGDDRVFRTQLECDVCGRNYADGYINSLFNGLKSSGRNANHIPSRRQWTRIIGS